MLIVLQHLNCVSVVYVDKTAAFEPHISVYTESAAAFELCISSIYILIYTDTVTVLWHLNNLFVL